MKIVNDMICPEDTLSVLLPARLIPDKATVRKRTGEKDYVLTREVALYTSEGRQVLAVGFFLYANGDVNQVQHDTLLHWVVTAVEFVDEMQRSWNEETPQ